jgi:hypothetical protein
MSLIVSRGENQSVRQGLGDAVRGTLSLTTTAERYHDLAGPRLVLMWLSNRGSACCLPTQGRQELARRPAAPLLCEPLATG